MSQSRSQVVVTPGGTTNYSTDALNFYTSVGGTTNVRDANGNLRDDGTHLYEYDYRNQLVRVKLKSDQSVVATYDYDGTRRRIAKATMTSTVQFYWTGVQLAMEYDAQGLISRRHYGARFGIVVSAYQRDISDLDQDGSSTDYVLLTPLYDGAHDCVGVLDHAGTLAESCLHTYDGKVTITNAAGTPIAASAIGWQQGYSGLYRDDEAGLYYSLHRSHSSVLNRFITEDPLGRWFDELSLGNGFTWVANRNRNGRDPLGLDVWIEGPSGGEKFAHESFNIGDPNGYYLSVSFALSIEWGNSGGQIYPDADKGGKISRHHYYSTSREVDSLLMKLMMKFLKEHKDKRYDYGLTNNCRTWSRRQFKKIAEWLEETGRGRKMRPPKRKKKKKKEKSIWDVFPGGAPG